MHCRFESVKIPKSITLIGSRAFYWSSVDKAYFESPEGWVAVGWSKSPISGLSDPKTAGECLSGYGPYADYEWSKQ